MKTDLLTPSVDLNPTQKLYQQYVLKLSPQGIIVVENTCGPSAQQQELMGTKEYQQNME